MGLWSRDLIVSFFFFYPRSCIYLQQLLLLSTCSISHSLNISSYFILYLSYWCLSFFLLSTPSLFLSYFLPKMFSIWQGSDGFHTLMYHRWIVLLGGSGSHLDFMPSVSLLGRASLVLDPGLFFYLLRLLSLTDWPNSNSAKARVTTGHGYDPLPAHNREAVPMDRDVSWADRGNPWKHREFLYCFCPNTCVPCKFICSNPNPQWNGTRRGGPSGGDEALKAEPLWPGFMPF